MTTIRHRINTFILSIVFQSLSSMKIFNQSKSAKCVDVRQCKHKDWARLQDVLQMLIVPSDRVKDLLLYKLSFTTQLSIFRVVNIIRRIIYAFLLVKGLWSAPWLAMMRVVHTQKWILSFFIFPLKFVCFYKMKRFRAYKKIWESADAMLIW